MTGVSERRKTCLQCDVAFSCYAENCWCAELPQIMSMKEGEDCLCPQCLKAAIEEKSADLKN